MKLPAILWCMVTAIPVQADDITVFAAASLQGPLDEVAARWEDETGHSVRISYSGSQELSAAILAGLPADVFISSSPDLIDRLQSLGHVTARKDLLGNALVLIAHGQDAAPVALDDLPVLLGDDLLSVALVEDTPAGQYTKTALDNLGLWDDLSRSVIQSDSVRAALDYVSRGEAPFGVVYATDPGQATDIAVVATFPPDAHPPIIYTAALVDRTPGAASLGFYDALSAAPADAIFARAGFALLH